MYLVWATCACTTAKFSGSTWNKKLVSHLTWRNQIGVVLLWFQVEYTAFFLARRIVEMSTYGKIEEFDRDSDTWEPYVERLNFYFEADQIEGEGDGLKLRRAILLSSVGKKTYKLMCDLLASENPGDKSYPELCTMVKNHFNPKPSESVQRHKFNNRFRASGGSISDFVAALRHLAEYCNFGGSLEICFVIVWFLE